MNIRNLIIVLLALILVVGFSPTVSTTAVSEQTRDLREILRPQKVVVLSAEVSGVITKMPFEFQDFVREGDLLVQLDSSLVEIEIKKIQVQIEMDTGIEEADIRLQYQKEYLDQVKKLAQKKISGTSVSAPKELNEAQQAHDLALLGDTKARLVLEGLKYDLQRNMILLQKHAIRAPWDGVLAKFSSIKDVINLDQNRQVGVGEMVQAVVQPVMALIKVDYLRFIERLSVRELPNVQLGQKARLFVEGYNEPVEAQVVFISPIMNTTDTFSIELEFANPLLNVEDKPKGTYQYRFRPGLGARMELIK